MRTRRIAGGPREVIRRLRCPSWGLGSTYFSAFPRWRIAYPRSLRYIVRCLCLISRSNTDKVFSRNCHYYCSIVYCLKCFSAPKLELNSWETRTLARRITPAARSTGYNSWLAKVEGHGLIWRFASQTNDDHEEKKQNPQPCCVWNEDEIENAARRKSPRIANAAEGSCLRIREPK